MPWAIKEKKKRKKKKKKAGERPQTQAVQPLCAHAEEGAGDEVTADIPKGEGRAQP